MAVFEELRPKSPFPEIGEDKGQANPFAPINPVRDPFVRNVDDEGLPDIAPQIFSADEDGDPVFPTIAEPTDESGIKSGALQNIGVNWADAEGKKTFFNDPGFYDVDFDPNGKYAERMGLEKNLVHAANVFGRQFSRDDLMKDSEGRRLLTLMEEQRTGNYKEEGFWSGLTDFHDLSGSYKKILADIPFLGWMVDAGSTVSETIDMSKSMKKLQNGEKVSDHEALAVRRYMLQQQMESERGIGYTAGSLVHSSIPFMFEMAASGAMIAGAAKAGAAIGTFIAPVVGTGVGAAIGAAVGATGAILFGGLGRVFTKAGRATISGATRGGAKFATNEMLGNVAKMEFGKDLITHQMSMDVRRTAAGMLGRADKELYAGAKEYGRSKALADMGREIAEKKLDKAAVDNMTEEGFRQLALATKDLDRRVLAQRSRFEAVKALADGAKAVYDPAMDAKLASRFLVNGDTERAVHYGFTGLLEDAALRKVFPVLEDAPTHYWARRSAIGQGMKQLTADEIKALRQTYAAGVIKGASGELVEGGNGLAKIVESMSLSLGGEGVVNHRFAQDVLDRMLDTSVRAAQLKYGADTAKELFVNNMQRFGQWFADGALDGLLRWDTNIFGGIGTIARSGTNLGGKMNALKEALKISFVEAPVRGALQLTAQAPLWPATAAVTGNNPMDFVIRGQLGIQSQALQTGDKELMDHARAIAFGSGLVEYISENAGRGFNVFASGIVKPTAQSLLPEPAKELGSYLSKKIEAVFGSERLMKAENQKMLADAVEAHLGKLAGKAGTRLPTVTRNEVEQFVKTRSAKGLANLERIIESTGESEGRLIRRAINEKITSNRVEAGLLYFTSYEMMRRGLTPQKMADLLQRVGYDGILSEMTEERYGGFFQGLLGLNERPSDEGFRGRIKAAMEGLFPDKDQLITEAIGFAVPSVTHLSLNHMYSRLGKAGVTGGIRRAAAGLNVGMNTITELNLPVDSPEYAAAVQEWRARSQQMFDERFGTEEENDAKLVANAASLRAKVNDGSWAPTKQTPQLKELGSDEETEAKMLELAGVIIGGANTMADLDLALQAHDAENVFGAEGVEAIRNQWRRQDGNTDEVKSKFENEGDYAAHRAAVPMPSDVTAHGATVDDVVNRITMALPVISQDQSVISDIRRRLAASDSADVRVNQYGEDMLSDACANATVIANAAYRAENGKTDAKGWFARGLMRLVGVMDAITTGDLSLAARNPVQWALADESLDKDLMHQLLTLKRKSVLTGLSTVLGRNRDTMKILTEEQRTAVKPVLDEIDLYEAQYNNAKDTDKAAAEQALIAKKDAMTRLDSMLSGFTSKFKATAFQDLDAGILAQAEAAGEASFQSTLREYMAAYLTAKNVLSVSRADLSEAALQVVAKRNERQSSGIESRFEYADASGNTVLAADFRTDEFKAAHAAEIEQARREIIQRLVQMASDRMIKINTNDRFNLTMSTAAVLDYQRAMANGTPKEILAAIQAMPAFASTRVVHDLSGGQLLTEENVEAFGRTGELAELLAMPTDGRLEIGDLRRVMKLMGRDFVFATEQANQTAAAQCLRRLHILAESALPTRHVDSASGGEVRVTYDFGRDADSGARVVTATVWNDDGTVRDTVGPAATVSQCVDQLRTFGVDAQMRKVVFAKSFSIASRDATSMLLTMLGSRDDAREYYRLNGVENNQMPPYLRKDPITGDWAYSFEDAMAKMREELAVANNNQLTDDVSEAVRTRVYGADEEGSRGYELVAEKFLESRGMRRTSMVREESVLLGGGQQWVIRPSSLPTNNMLVVTSDYQSSGDAEALLRTTVRNALYNAWMRSDYTNLDHAELREILADAVSAFNEAGKKLAAELAPLHPDLAVRIDKALESFGADEGRLNFEKLAAIVSSVVCFTSERGLGEAGNGYLFSPEIAAIADEMRAMPETLSLLSVVDEALGGTGLCNKEGNQLPELSRLVAAFSPTGETIVNSRKTAIFNRTGIEYAPKPGIAIPEVAVGPTTVTADGKSVLVNFTSRAVDTNNNLDFASVAGLLGRIAENVRQFTSDYLRETGSDLLTTGMFHRLLKQATAKGGKTAGSAPERASVGRAKSTSVRYKKVGGAWVHVDDTPGARPRTSEVISEVDAVKFARNLTFLIRGDAKDRAAGLAGKLTDVDALRVALRGKTADGTEFESDTREAVRDFLVSRGMDDQSIEVVMRQLVNGLGSASVSEEETDENVEDVLNDAVDEGAAVESWHDARKTNDATENKDLIALGRQLMHIFPHEKRNHMAIFARLYTELDRIAASENPCDAVKKIAKCFNVLRSDRDGKAIQDIANADGWDDAALTDSRLTKAVVWLADNGHAELAFALNGLRRLGSVKQRKDGTLVNVRRTKALRNIGYFARIDADATYVTFKDNAVEMSARPAGSGEPGCEDAMRAVFGGLLMNSGFKANTVDEMQNELQLINRLLAPGSEYGWKTEHQPLLDALSADDAAGLDEGMSLLSVVAKLNPGDRITGDIHAAVCGFASALAHRLAKVADAVDILFHRGNEFSYSLRNPDMVSMIVRDIEFMLQRKMRDGQTTEEWRKLVEDSVTNEFIAIYRETFPDDTHTSKDGTKKYYHTCQLIETTLFRPLIGIARTALEQFPGEEPFRAKMVKALYGSDVIPRCSRADFKSNLGFRLTTYTTKYGSNILPLSRDQWTVSARPGKTASRAAKIFGWYTSTMPRSTIRVSGHSADQFRESGQVNGLPASPIVAQARLEDNLLSKIGNVAFGQDIPGTLRDQYFQNGGRFFDGSRLICASAGAAIDGEIADRAFVPRLVFMSNVHSYVDKLDTRNLKFQLYHGEKPTVYSVQLPGYVCDKIYSDILKGEAYTANRYISRDVGEGKTFLSTLENATLDKISTPEARRAAYDAIFSVVASFAGCDEIDSKRTQVLMSQGTPFAGHRDFYYDLDAATGIERKVTSDSVRNQKTGEAIKPATHFVISISGETATANMGMYFAHGRLIEAQRGISTNPDSVSFKNHLTDWSGVGLTKGQCHAIRIGMYEDEETMTQGVMREAQRVQRRELERTLGLEDKILDIPDETQKADAGHMANREAAVKLVEAFYRFSTTVSTDMETQKSGPFGSRCGFYAKSESDLVTVTVAGKTVVLNLKEGKVALVSGASEEGKEPEWKDIPKDIPKPEFKNNAWPVALVVPAIMSALEVDELSEEDVASMKTKWKNGKDAAPVNAELANARIFNGLRMENGDRVSFAKSENGGYVVRYSNRSTIGQIMANADATSRSTNEHPAATNYVRDLIANQAYRGDLEPSESVAAIVTVARAVPQCVFRASGDESHPNGWLIEDRLDADADFAFKRANNPYSTHMRDQLTRKTNAIYAKAMRVYPSATHAVLCGSGLMASLDRQNHRASVERSAGVTDWDVDALRSARILTKDASDAYKALYGKQYAVDRTYASGLVNITGDSTFRYGWYLDLGAFSAMNLDAYLKGVLTADDTWGLDLVAKYKDVLSKTSDAPEQEIEAVARIAALMKVVKRNREKGKTIVADVFGKCFTDYTGKYLADSPCNLEKVSVDDLFIGDEFDLLAVDLGSRKRLSNVKGDDGKLRQDIYIGGSFFSGDRRPSGNFESAGGLARATAPVTQKADGSSGDSAMYVLDPVQMKSQGADTDGDSATLIKMCGRGPSASAAQFVREVFDYFTRLQKEAKGIRSFNMTRDQAEAFVAEFSKRPEFKRYFELNEVQVKGGKKKVIDVTELFSVDLGNLLFQAQIDNYRMIETREQSPAAGRSAVRGVDLASESGEDIRDVGFSGRDPVGPDVVFDTPVPESDNASRALYSRIVGKDMPAGLKYNKAFKACINAITEKAGIAGGNLELLDAEVAAFLSGSAADANGARGVMVALQAAIEHLKGYANNDSKIRELAPALYETLKDSEGNVVYDPIREFVEHFDGVSNALFDVVKDLFAPRAGWQKNMLNYLVGSLVKAANDEYARAADKTAVRFNDAWFFNKLVRYAENFHNNETSIPGLLKKAAAGNNYLDEEKFGTATAVRTLRGMVKDAMDPNSDTVLRFFAETFRTSAVEDDEDLGRIRAYTGPTFAKELEAVTGTVDNSFEAGFSRWLRRLGYSLKSRGDAILAEPGSPLAIFFDKAGKGELPGSLQRLIDADAAAPLLDENGNTVAEETGLLKACVDFTAQLADVLTGADAPAIAGHFLLGSVSDFASNFQESLDASAALADLKTIQEVNASVSPEPVFQKGGEKAIAAAGKLSTLEGHTDENDSMARTQAFVIGNRFNAQASSFDSRILSGSIADGVSTMQEQFAGKNLVNNYNELCRRAGIQPFDASNVNDVITYVAATMRGSQWAKPGQVDSNRQMMGPMLYAVKSALDSCIAATGSTELGMSRLVALFETYLPGFAVGANTLRERQARDRKAEQGPTNAEDMVFNDQFDFDETAAVGAPEKSQKGTSLLGALVQAALAQSATSKSDFFLQHIKVIESKGTISLESKLGPGAATMLREGFEELKNNRSEVIPGSTFTDGANSFELNPADIALLLQMHLCSHQSFDSVNENDTRVDVATMFSASALREMERFGAAAESSFAGRALCRVPQKDNGYDLLRAPRDRDFSGVPVTGLVHAVFPKGNWDAGRVSSDVIRPAKAKNLSPLGIMLRMVGSQNSSWAKRVQALVAEENRRRAARASQGLPPVENNEFAVESSFMSGDFDIDAPEQLDELRELNYAPFQFVGQDGEYDTIEGAVNSYGQEYVEYIESHGVTREKDVAKFLRAYTMLRTQAETKTAGHNPYTFAGIAERVLEDTRASVGDEEFAKWLAQAVEKGGDASLNPGTLEAIRNAVRAKDEELNPKPEETEGTPERAHVGVGLLSSAVGVRMLRSGIADFLQTTDPVKYAQIVSNPFENVKFALETAFGKFDRKNKTGVSVTRVSRKVDGKVVPMSLIKVQRYIRTTENGATRPVLVTTYISYGENLKIDLSTDEALESVLETLNEGEDRKMTLDELKRLGPERVSELVRSLGLRVNGLSKTGLTTDALLTLTGLVRLGNGADYFTLFHEYFHQMLDFCKRTGICTKADEAALAKAFSRDGKFNEEAAANAFADYVVGKSEGLRGKMLASGLGGDIDDLFEKFHVTAASLLAGAAAFDVDGEPAFMRMLITGDFTERESKHAEEVSAAKMKQIENILLEEETDYDIESNYERPTGPVAESTAETVNAVRSFYEGKGDIRALADAIDDIIAHGKEPGGKPVFPAQTEPFGVDPAKAEQVPEKNLVPPPPATVTGQIMMDKSVPRGVRLQSLLSEALKRFEAQDSLSDDEKRAIMFLRDRVGNRNGNVSFDSYDLIATVADRILTETCNALGVNKDRWIEDWLKENLDPEVQAVSPKTATNPDGTVIHFTEANHKYWTDLPSGGQLVYTSGTSFIHAFGDEFNPFAVSRRIANGDEDKAAKIREGWAKKGEDSSRRGTKIHSVFEDVFNGAAIRAVPDNEMERKMILHAQEIARRIMRDYEIVGSEVIVFDPETKLAGSIDLLARNKKTGEYTIIDHKTNEVLRRKGWKGATMKYGLDSLQDCNFSHYALQLNLYRRLLKKSGMVPADAKVNLVINHYNGLDADAMDAIRDKAVTKYGEDPATVNSEEWIEDIPDLDAEVDKMLEFAAKQPDLVLIPSGTKVDPNKPNRPPEAGIVAELAVRLAHRIIGSTVAVDSTGRPTKPVEKFERAVAEVGTVVNQTLARENPAEWPAAVRRLATHASDVLASCAEDLRARAGVSTDEDDQAELLRAADDLETRGERLELVVDTLIRGADVDKVVGHGTLGADLFQSLCEYVIGDATCETAPDGTLRFVKGAGEAMDLEGKGCQHAADLAMQAIGAATVINRYVIENGVEFPAIGATATIPVRSGPVLVPIAPVAVNGELEPDVTPQMILQSQTSWMASDITRSFCGVNLRDMMTDSSLQAVTEETNRVANQLDYYFGADVCVGGRARVIETVASNLGRGKNGLFEVDASHRHLVRRAAAVRGYMLGIVTRAAKTEGREFTLNDVNMVNLAGQAYGALAGGDSMVITGFDISTVQRDQLTHIGTPGTLGAVDPAKLVSENGWYNVNAVIARVKGKPRGEAVGQERPSNLDQLLYRVATGLPAEISGCLRDQKTGKISGEVVDGVFKGIIEAYAGVFSGKKKSVGAVGRRATDIQVRDAVVQYLMEDGYALRNADGKAVLTIPVEDVNKVWLASDTVAKLVEAGRQKSMLDLHYAAWIVGKDATRLNRAAMKTKFMTDGMGTGLAGHGAAGLWFESGSGHHGLMVDQYNNARETFGKPVEIDETMKNKMRNFTLTAEADNRRKRLSKTLSLVTGNRGGAMVRGLERAFATDDNGNLINLSGTKLQHLLHLMGWAKRTEGSEIKRFISGVENGLYSKSNVDNPTTLDLDKDMTLFELDRQIFEYECALLAEERLNGDKGTVLTRPESEGGFGFSRDELVTLNEVLRRTGIKMLSDAEASKKVSGVVNSLTEETMFRKFGTLPSSKTGSERLRSMAESIVHSERFRGCLAQMLTTVGSDGLPNYIVDPSGSCETLAPDPFWGALAKFVGQKVGGYLEQPFQYDDFKSGVQNMKDLAQVLKKAIEADAANAKKNGGKRRMRWRALPPGDIGAENMFDSLFTLDDRADDDTSVMNNFVGGEAAGYIKQLFGVVSSPSIWHGWKVVDRMMSYSKAASVGMSAFFAFATRFESPVAACGLLNTLPGYSKATADLMRALSKTGFGKSFSKVMEAMGMEGLDGKMPYLTDFMQNITSDDPSIRDMRELCDLCNIPLSDAIRNPMNDAGGYIDQDIKRIKRMLEAGGHHKWAKEIDGILKAALQNPGEYAFSNVLNCVQMAVVAQTMYRLRHECEAGDRPFDPVKELRRIAPYLSTEIGGITSERYAWLTPGMQRILRMAMFSWQWTMSAWTAGCGETITDAIFGGHNTNAARRQYAFVRWMRMLGIVKVGVPVVMQATIRGIAAILQRTGLVGDPDDPKDTDPLGIERMPWLCFDNESKIGSLCFDVTPILKLAGRIRKGADDFAKETVPGYRDYIAPHIPWITGAVGAGLGAYLTKSVGGTGIGLAAGAAMPSVLPGYDDVGRGRNTSGRRRYYMHFGKQSDEFWRWFTDAWAQVTSKLSIPTQKVVEAFFGSSNGSSFSKAFADKDLVDRFITGGLDPQQNAIVNFFTAFMPFSAASLADHPDAGAMAMFAPIQMGASMTGSQKRIVERLRAFAEDDSRADVWASPRNRRSLELLCADILAEADLNGMDPKEVLKSGLAQVSHDLYGRLFDALPKREDDVIDARVATEALRGLYRINRKMTAINQALRKDYKNANVDWKDQKNRSLRLAVKYFLRNTKRDPWINQENSEKVFKAVFEADRRSVRQAGKGGDAFKNFLATDELPETLFGVPIVEATAEDAEFFRRNPEAAGFYDMGDGSDGNGGPTPPDDRGGRRADKAEGTTEDLGKYGPIDVLKHVVGGQPLPKIPREGIGGDTFDAGAFLKAIEAGKGTERDVYREMYKLAPEGTADRVYDETMKARIAMYEESSRKKLTDLYAAGKIGLEDVPILAEYAGPTTLPDGTVIDTATTPWDESKYRSRKSYNLAHPGEFRVVGKAAMKPGTHVQETARLNRSGSNWSTAKDAEMDAQGRSAAYPGDSTIVLHGKDAGPEEFVHLMTRSKVNQLNSDDAQKKAIDDAGGALNSGMAYYGFGNYSERRDAMSVLKAAMTVMGKDATDKAQREEFLRSLDDKGFPEGTPDARAADRLAIPNNARSLLKAMQLLRYKRIKNRPLNESEAEADRDLSSDYMWKVVSVGDGTRNAIRAAAKGGRTRKGRK